MKIKAACGGKFRGTALRLLGVASIALLSASCATLPHRDLTRNEQVDAQVPGVPDARFWADLPPPPSAKPMVRSGPVTVLALSGGGDNGAYGAGFLDGWGRTGQRPEFTVVTGVSVGALIAPFAFLGSKYDGVIGRALTSNKPGQLYSARFPLAIPFSDSAVSSAPLARTLVRYVPDAMIDEIGAQYRLGRRLFVGTANFDAARAVVWNMGAIAASDAPGRYLLFRKVLLASAAVPDLFPPVLIGAVNDGRPIRELHVDGSTISGILAIPGGGQATSASMVGPEATRYLIVNDTLGGDFKVVNGTILRIAQRAFALASASSLRDEVLATYLWTQRVGSDFNLTYIDKDFDFGAPHRYLDPAFTHRLYDYGVRRGMAHAWLTRPPSGDPVKN